MAKKKFYDNATDTKNGGMISGSVGIANMPTEVVQKYYPKDGPYMTSDLNDGITGVDSQKSGDVGKAKSQLKNVKY